MWPVFAKKTWILHKGEKVGKGRVRGKNSHPTFLDWKLDGVGKIFGGRRGREGTIQKKWRGPKSDSH